MNVFVCLALVLAAVAVTGAASAHQPNLANKFFGNRPSDVNDEIDDDLMPESRSIVLNRIRQRVDNFNPQNTDTFEQRYLMNGEHFQPGGPLFVVLGGEWQITPLRLQNNSIETIASELFGYVFYLEHRFYGASIPTS